MPGKLTDRGGYSQAGKKREDYREGESTSSMRGPNHDGEGYCPRGCHRRHGLEQHFPQDDRTVRKSLTNVTVFHLLRCFAADAQIHATPKQSDNCGGALAEERYLMARQ